MYCVCQIYKKTREKGCACLHDAVLKSRPALKSTDVFCMFVEDNRETKEKVFLKVKCSYVFHHVITICI